MKTPMISLRDLFWLVRVVVVALGWRMDRTICLVNWSHRDFSST
jgi:hypothetical protein